MKVLLNNAAQRSDRPLVAKSAVDTSADLALQIESAEKMVVSRTTTKTQISKIRMAALVVICASRFADGTSLKGIRKQDLVNKMVDWVSTFPVILVGGKPINLYSVWRTDWSKKSRGRPVFSVGIWWPKSGGIWFLYPFLLGFRPRRRPSDQHRLGVSARTNGAHCAPSTSQSL